MRIEKTEQGKTKNGLRYYLFPRTSFGEQMAAVLVQRGANHLSCTKVAILLSKSMISKVGSIV